MVTDMIKWLWGQPTSKCQIKDYHNMDRLSVCSYSYYSENLHWAAQNLRLGQMWPAGWTELF